MFVTVVINNWNGRELLERCLQSIKPGLPPASSEVIVVDNLSTDGSKELLEKEFPEVGWVLPDRRVSAAAATNLGIQKARGDVIVHLDNDIEMVTRDWVSRLTEPIESMASVGIIGCRIVDERGRTNHLGGVISPWKLQGVAHMNEKHGSDRWIESDYVTGAVFLMSRTLINRVGGWNEAYGPVYFDDTEYCARARRHGFRILCDTEVVARHRISQTVRATRSARERARIYHRNRLRFIRQYSRGSDLVVRALVEPLGAIQTIAFRTSLGYVLALVDTIREGRTNRHGKV